MITSIFCFSPPLRLSKSLPENRISILFPFNLISKSFEFDDKVVIQPYISNFKEVNQAAYFYNNEVIASKLEEVFKNDKILSFEDKYIVSKTGMDKKFISDEKLIENVSELTKKIYKLLELSGVVRIDYMIIDEKIYVNEINTTPGSLSFYLFDDGVSFFKRLIYEALKKHQNKRIKTFDSFILYQKNFYKK